MRHPTDPTRLTPSIKHVYALPLEIVYMTPLTKWNPYNLQTNPVDAVTAGGRTGGMLPARAFNGTNPAGFFYRTPAEFFTENNGMLWCPRLSHA